MAGASLALILALSAVPLSGGQLTPEEVDERTALGGFPGDGRGRRVRAAERHRSRHPALGLDAEERRRGHRRALEGRRGTAGRLHRKLALRDRGLPARWFSRPSPGPADDRTPLPGQSGIVPALDRGRDDPENERPRKIKTPSIKIFGWNRATYLQRAFDNLIANEDRHTNQLLITADWRVILIDHSRSFRTSKKFTRELIFTERHREGPQADEGAAAGLRRKAPRPGLRRACGRPSGNYLEDDEIAAVLARRDLILAEVDRLIANSARPPSSTERRAPPCALKR